MDEARQVIDRLDRIEELRRDEAPTTVLLAEVRALLADGERWLAAEPGAGLASARAALERCREELERPQEVVPGAAL
jgi:hypothetical protein